MRINRCDLSFDSLRPWGGFLFHSCDIYNAFFSFMILHMFLSLSRFWPLGSTRIPALSLSFLFHVLYWPSLGQIFFIILAQGTSSASSSVSSSASTSAFSSASFSASSSFLPLLSGFVYCPSALCSRPSGPMALSPPIYCHKELKCISTYF